MPEISFESNSLLEQRILDTLRFFDLQDLPLTFFEVHKYLIANLQELRPKLDDDFELMGGAKSTSEKMGIDSVVLGLDVLVLAGKLDKELGYYCLPGKKHLVSSRLNNYYYGIHREKLIKKYVAFLRHMPFVRGVAITGSQALGQEKPSSDIDLLVITDTKYMWTARTLISAYFQLFKLRRHGKNISNRFCLNHYIAGDKVLMEGRSLYAASEYVKLRPVVYAECMNSFAAKNMVWMDQFFPNIAFKSSEDEIFKQSLVQRGLEFIFRKVFVSGLENKLKQVQKKRIHTDQYVRVREDELSFHPHSKQEKLLQAFFKFQKQE